tara:strand:- start:22 stop:192 length:171 start_codon:yes stop_codon:yes gene_type:complete
LTAKILAHGENLELDMETLTEDVEMIVDELGDTFIGALDGAIVGYLLGRNDQGAGR